MKCFEEILYSEFIDNELKPEIRKKVLAHLEECEKCQKVVVRIKRVNSKLKELFEIEQNIPDLIPVVMDKIATPESQYFKEKKPWSFLIYGIFILTGIIAPYFLSIYLKSTDLFQNILSLIFTRFYLISSAITFILREVILITPEELTGIIIGQISFIILFILIFSSNLIRKKKSLKEDYK